MPTFPWKTMLAVAAYLCCACLPAAAAETEKRVALVIGNAAYQSGRLSGPDNDASDIAALLGRMGFKISNAGRLTDLDRTSMESVILEFFNQVDQDTVAIVYYSGHGLEDSLANYLVPTDARLENWDAIGKELIPLEWILKRLRQREARTKVIILDACRNMPMALRFKSPDAPGGLKPIWDFATGTRIVYAAEPDHVAASAPAGQRNSVFTGSLLRALQEKPSLDEALLRAAQLTRDATGNRQNPWSSGTMSTLLMTPPNPLSQDGAGSQPLWRVSVPTPATPNCTEVSEQTRVNGVVTWTKKCI